MVKLARDFARMLRPASDRRHTKASLRAVEVVVDNGTTIDCYFEGHVDVTIEGVPKLAHHGTFDPGDTVLCLYEDGFLVVLGKEA